jgi:ribonucleoside-diphosphate reductase alpha chain
METASSIFQSDIARHIWNTKYRYRKIGTIIDETVEDSWRRVSRALASAEEDPDQWETEFYQALEGFKFVPGGRVLAGAGTRHKVTLFNCFVMGIIEDSIPSIFENLKEGALTMQQGGGVGYDFSTLRPKGSLARSSNNISSGPVSFMKVWDTMCETMISTGARRGAMMATLRCDHPDIVDFIKAKQEPGQLTNFNLSVLISDAFMEAVDKNEDWPLIFPDKELDNDNTTNQIVFKRWSGTDVPVSCRVFNTVKARELWKRLIESAYATAEPGVLFIDRINELNNLGYCEYITSTNPCGEVPLPPYGACDLGSINLTQFVQQPFSGNARFDLEGIRQITQTAVRMLDNVITISGFPLQKQKEKAVQTRRIGLGITGLGDALIILGLHYGSTQARSLADKIMTEICNTAYRTSAELAKEKSPFPLYVEDSFMKNTFIQRLPDEIQNEILKNGIRNSHLLSIAPTGSISILANNVSSGLEPVYDFKYSRKILNRDGTTSTYEIADYAYRLWKEQNPDRPLPDYFVRARDLAPKDHLAMQAVLQKHVDNSISKTINIPKEYPLEQFKNIYRQAYDKNLKGCTTFRPNEVTGAILESMNEGETNVHCCSLEREGD